MHQDFAAYFASIAEKWLNTVNVYDPSGSSRFTAVSSSCDVPAGIAAAAAAAGASSASSSLVLGGRDRSGALSGTQRVYPGANSNVAKTLLDLTTTSDRATPWRAAEFGQ